MAPLDHLTMRFMCVHSSLPSVSLHETSDASDY